MDLTQYQQQLSELSIGKRQKDAIYIHAEAFWSQANGQLQTFIAEAVRFADVTEVFNIYKLYLNDFKISFLSYPSFFEAPHPVLVEAISVDLGSQQVKRLNYRNTDNPPILHRKEQFLAPEHPLNEKFSRMTQAEESVGLYDNVWIIGFKKNWEALVSQKGLIYQDHELIQSDTQEKVADWPVVVRRHKTAISRYRLSRPVQTLFDHELLSKDTTIFDYGAGKGGDVEGLGKMGFAVTGWDPVYRPDSPKQLANIVNLGFVLNVIENIEERSEVLKEAFNLAQNLLVVSAQMASRETQPSGRPYKDGILTSRNTFQKYYHQAELRDYLETTLQNQAVAISNGIFYIFRSVQAQEEFLQKRSKRKINWKAISRDLYPKKPRAKKTIKTENLLELYKDLLESFWNRMLDLGRPPDKEEFAQYDELITTIGSLNRAKKLFIQVYGEETLQRAFEMRRNDLLIYLALSNFDWTIPYKHLPKSIQRDIKTFLGGYEKGLQESRRLLFSIAKPDEIARLCDATSFGYLDEQALFVHKSLINDLHPLLRIYIGCAERLFGDVHQADIIKLHKHSGKVTLLCYDDFDNNPLPELYERIKINLREQQVDVFDYRAGPHKPLLYFKERYVSADHPRLAVWKEMTQRLITMGIPIDQEYGPNKTELKGLLEAKGTSLEELAGMGPTAEETQTADFLAEPATGNDKGEIKIQCQ